MSLLRVKAYFGKGALLCIDGSNLGSRRERHDPSEVLRLTFVFHLQDKDFPVVVPVDNGLLGGFVEVGALPPDKTTIGPYVVCRGHNQ